MSARRDQGPRFVAWWIAAISLVLPFVGGVLAIIGIMHLYRGGALGWLLYAGIACFILDLAIDVCWAHPSVSRSDEPDLNARGAQLVGRMAIVEEAIEHGRGKVRVGDTVWAAEGQDLPKGSQCRVAGARGTTLMLAADQALPDRKPVRAEPQILGR
jgi:hypothetical protein